MAPEVIVRAFLGSEWQQYKQLRLDSLLESPEAFGGTYEQEVKRSEQEWQSRLFSGFESVNDLALVAKFGEKCNGLALLSKIRDWAEKERISVLYLGVSVNNVIAYRLYENFGFEAVGDLEPLRPVSVLQMQPMRLILFKA